MRDVMPFFLGAVPPNSSGRIVLGAMRSSSVRYLALGVLVAGVAAIVWTAAGGDGGDDPADPATEVPEITAPETPETPETPAPATSPEATAPETTSATTTVTPEPIQVLGVADTLAGLDGWLNTDATSLEEIQAANKLTVVQFWTFGCRNCKNTLDALSQLYADFRDRGVEIVGVHSPEFSYEADVNNI